MCVILVLGWISNYFKLHYNLYFPIGTQVHVRSLRSSITVCERPFKRVDKVLWRQRWIGSKHWGFFLKHSYLVYSNSLFCIIVMVFNTHISAKMQIMVRKPNSFFRTSLPLLCQIWHCAACKGERVVDGILAHATESQPFPLWIGSYLLTNALIFKVSPCRV